MLNLRLEYNNWSENSHKFYELVQVGTKTGKVLARWGRIGKSADEMLYDEETARKKLREKVRKGYIKVRGTEW